MKNKKEEINKEEEIIFPEIKELKKKKFRKVNLEKINLNTSPINISFVREDYNEYSNLGLKRKTRFKTFSIIAGIIITILILFFILRGKSHHQNKIEEINNKNNNLSDINNFKSSNFNNSNSSSLFSSVNAVNSSSSLSLNNTSPTKSSQK